MVSYHILQVVDIGAPLFNAIHFVPMVAAVLLVLESVDWFFSIVPVASFIEKSSAPVTELHLVFTALFSPRCRVPVHAGAATPLG